VTVVVVDGNGDDDDDDNGAAASFVLGIPELVVHGATAFSSCPSSTTSEVTVAGMVSIMVENTIESFSFVVVSIPTSADLCKLSMRRDIIVTAMLRSEHRMRFF
jgi:hypothetical protein